MKRLAKTVSASTATVLTLLEQLDKAEEELYVGLGDLGRFLESAYGVNGDLWDDRMGIRRIGKERRMKEKEDLEVLVDHGLKAVRHELKRQGLAGGAAHARFEVSQIKWSLRETVNESNAKLIPPGYLANR